MPEIPGQINTGTPLSEIACFQVTIEGLQHARDGLRGLAIMRGDMKWLMVVRLIEELIDRVTKMMNRGGRPLMWMPHREPRR